VRRSRWIISARARRSAVEGNLLLAVVARGLSIIDQEVRPSLNVRRVRDGTAVLAEDDDHVWKPGSFDFQSAPRSLTLAPG